MTNFTTTLISKKLPVVAHDEDDILAGAHPDALRNLARLSSPTDAMAAAAEPLEIIRSLDDQGPLVSPTFLIANHIKALLLRESQDGRWPSNMKRGVSARAAIYVLLGQDQVSTALMSRGLDVEAIREAALQEIRSYDLHESDGSGIVLSPGQTRFTDALIYEEPLAVLMTQAQFLYKLPQGTTTLDIFFRIIADPNIDIPQSLADLGLTNDILPLEYRTEDPALQVTAAGAQDSDILEVFAGEHPLVGDFLKSPKKEVRDLARELLEFLESESGQHYTAKPIGLEMLLGAVIANEDTASLLTNAEVDIASLKIQCLAFHNATNTDDAKPFDSETVAFETELAEVLKDASNDGSINGKADLLDVVLLGMHKKSKIPQALQVANVTPGVFGVGAAGNTHLGRPKTLRPVAATTKDTLCPC